MLDEFCSLTARDLGACGFGHIRQGQGAVCTHVRRLCKRVIATGIRAIYKLSCFFFFF